MRVDSENEVIAGCMHGKLNNVTSERINAVKVISIWVPRELAARSVNEKQR